MHELAEELNEKIQEDSMLSRWFGCEEFTPAIAQAKLIPPEEINQERLREGRITAHTLWLQTIDEMPNIGASYAALTEELLEDYEHSELLCALVLNEVGGDWDHAARDDVFAAISFAEQCTVHIPDCYGTFLINYGGRLEERIDELGGSLILWGLRNLLESMSGEFDLVVPSNLLGGIADHEMNPPCAIGFTLKHLRPIACKLSGLFR